MKIRLTRRKAFLLIAVVGFIILCAGVFTWRQLDGRISGREAVALYRVKPLSELGEDAMLKAVRICGVLECTATVPIVTHIHGRVTELINSGSHIKKGDVVVSQDSTEAREAVDNYETEMTNIELNVVRLDAQYRLTEFQESENVRLHDSRLKHAVLEEAYELGKPDARDCRIMDIDERLAELDEEDAQDVYDREKRMFDKKYISESALETYDQRLKTARASLAELRLENILKKKGATDERRVELRMNVLHAQHNKARRESYRQRRVAEIESQRDAEVRNMERVRYLLEYNENDVAQATVAAPMNGVFRRRQYRDWRNAGAIMEVTIGDEKWQNDIVGELVDPTKMDVRLVVNEADFHQLRAGMPVEVRLPALPGKLFRGKLVRLGAIGRDRNSVDPTGHLSGESEVSMFSALIELEATDEAFHPGMSALVSILVQTKLPEESVLIPRMAVNRQDDGSYFVKKTRGKIETAVKGRYYNEQYFLVEEGVSLNDELVLNMPGTEGDLP